MKTMKMYTNSEQTVKLIKLGFKKPKSIQKMIPQPVVDGYVHLIPQKAYSIGELLSILPSTVGEYYDLHIEFSITKWYVAYYWIGNGEEYHIKYEFSACELIDALYDMIVKLKEEGVI